MKHTNKKDCFITFWKPNSAGYCYSLNLAGVYENPEKGYHDNEDNMSIESEIIERMGSTILYDGELKTMVPNNKYVLDELGLKYIGLNLKRVKS